MRVQVIEGGDGAHHERERPDVERAADRDGVARDGPLREEALGQDQRPDRAEAVRDESLTVGPLDGKREFGVLGGRKGRDGHGGLNEPTT
jgi:hypothetical protein